jgi:cyclic pyranopterin phosphate synthase
MPIAEGAKIAARRFVSAAEMRSKLGSLLAPDEARSDADRGPAKYVSARGDDRLRVGFITGTSDTFCESCDRLRVAADGMLRPCLATEVGVSAKADAEHGDAPRVAVAVEEAWKLKPDGTAWKGCTEPTAAHVSMRAIGG